MKDALHGESQILVVAVDGSWVLSSMGGGEFLSSGQQRFDGLVAEHEQGSDGPQARRNGFVATGRADPLDDLFTAKFLQIVCCLAGAVGGWTLIAARASPGEMQIAPGRPTLEYCVLKVPLLSKT